MITKRKVLKIGGSNVITLPNNLKLISGKTYDFSIKVLNLEEVIVEYRCILCDSKFVRNLEDDLYCPVCENENEDTIEVFEE